MGQPLTLDEVQVAPEDAAQIIYDLRRRIAAVVALHPKIEDPRHGCCAHPKLCSGHAPECGASEHGLNRPDWPCPTLVALNGGGSNGTS